jgi:hypothetical protein
MLSVESPGAVVDSFKMPCRHHRFMWRTQLKLRISEMTDELDVDVKLALNSEANGQ